MKPIRVLHILHSMDRGGAENAIMNYYRHIDRNKVQFDFLLTIHQKSQFEDEILNLGGRVFRVPQLLLYHPFPYIIGVFKFFMRHKEYSIVHSHTSSKSVFPLAIAKLCNIPIRICHSHNNHSEAGFRGIIRDILKFPLRGVSTHLFACSKEAACWLYGSFKGKERIILPNVIETSHFLYDSEERVNIRELFSIDEPSIVIGCTARFSLQKNHLFLLSVFSCFHLKHPNSHLLLVGDGELRYEIERQIKRLGIMDCVHITGVVPDAGRYYSAMDLFILPSLYEGLGMVFVEAQVSGLRCFASCGVAREADVTGLVSFIPLEEGPEYWANQIENSIDYSRLSQVYRVVEAGYDAATSSKFLQEFYERVYRDYVN